MWIPACLAAQDLLSQRGYDPVLGARPLRRTIQREIEDSLSEKILFGEPRPGQIVIKKPRAAGRRPNPPSPPSPGRDAARRRARCEMAS